MVEGGAKEVSEEVLIEFSRNQYVDTIVAMNLLVCLGLRIPIGGGGLFLTSAELAPSDVIRAYEANLSHWQNAGTTRPQGGTAPADAGEVAV